MEPLRVSLLVSFTVSSTITPATIEYSNFNSQAINIQDVIAMCVVIASHYYLQGETSIKWILNEAGIFAVGTGIGVLINMYIPTNIHKIHEVQKKLQEEVSIVLIDIAAIIVNPNKENGYSRDLYTLN